MEYFVVYFKNGGYAALNVGYENDELSSMGEIERLELKKVEEDGFTKVLKTWNFEK